jgi:phage terminase large subunit-like protein
VIEPRISLVPDGGEERGREAIEVARRAGLELDDWQQHALMGSLRTQPNGKWAALEVGVDVARQNGKGGILEARELAGIFAFDERLIIHSAHLVDTSLEAMERLLWLMEDVPEFECQVKRVVRTNGREGIIFKSGQRIRFRTRTKGGGRGFTADCILLDESMFLPEMTVAALVPTLSARPNPQIWYTGSAVDQQVHEHGSVFARIRRRGMAGDKGVAYFEWSAPYELDEISDYVDDPDVWRMANPAMGIRINEEFVKTERRALDLRSFAVERLGVGDWPDDADEAAAIDWDEWRALHDNKSFMLDPVCLAFDVTPSRDRCSIAAAGLRPDGLLHCEVAEYRRNTGWVAKKLAEITAKQRVHSVVYDARSPAAALRKQLEGEFVDATAIDTRGYADACGAFTDLVADKRLRHLAQDELNSAVKNAATRPLGDAWAWSRKVSAADISPLVAVTLALWQASEKLTSVYEERGVIAL